jgi:Ca2+:H+ antiporter
VKRKWWIYVLLLAVPLAVAAFFLNRQGGYRGQLTYWIFGLALVAVIPLATLIGQFTDSLSDFYGDRIGGLLGASFGNVPELAIGIFLLVHAGRHVGSLVATSDVAVIRGLLIGSVVNNVLFVLGSSIFLAALRNGRMQFSASSAAGYSSMLALAVVGLALPTLAVRLLPRGSVAITTGDVVSISVSFSVILILSYIAYILSSVLGLGTRRHAPTTPESGHAVAAGAEGMPLLRDDPSEETVVEKILKAEEGDDTAGREERRKLRREQRGRVMLVIGGLTVVTVLTVVIAAMLVSVTDNVIQSTVLTPLSVGLILFPIVCNLGEQAGAVVTAWRNHMEGAMSVAAGSSVQVALFVTPVLVLLSYPIAWIMRSTGLTLLFEPLELIVLGLVAFVYALVSLDGETTWLEGLQLLAFYAMIVAVAFALPGV